MTQNISNNSDFDEQEYRSHISQEILFVTRLVSILGIVMFMAYFFVDFWAFSQVHESLLYVRLVVAVVLGITLLSTYSPVIFEKFSLFILPVPYLVASMGINYMIFLANPTDYASQVYFVGLMLIIMMLFAWSFLKLSVSLGVSIFILTIYAYIVVYEGGANEKELITNLLINLSFLISSAIIGFISQLIRDRHLKENFLLQQSLKEALKEKEKEAKGNAYLANHDALTGLPNRRYMVELLNESLEVAKSTDKILIIMFFDLNGFKQVNDIYGHAAGDEVLNIVSKRMELAIRKGDHIARLGGDEFLLGLLMDKDSLDEVDKIKEKFNHIISQPMKIDGQKIITGTSIGIAAYPIHGNNVEVLIDIADKKMYKAKHSSRTGLEEGPIDKGLGKEPVVIFPGYSKRQ